MQQLPRIPGASTKNYYPPRYNNCINNPDGARLIILARIKSARRRRKCKWPYLRYRISEGEREFSRDVSSSLNGSRFQGSVKGQPGEEEKTFITGWVSRVADAPIYPDFRLLCVCIRISHSTDKWKPNLKIKKCAIDH